MAVPAAHGIWVGVRGKTWRVLIRGVEIGSGGEKLELGDAQRVGEVAFIALIKAGCVTAGGYWSRWWPCIVGGVQGRLMGYAQTHDWVGEGWPGEDRKWEHGMGVLSGSADVDQLAFAVVVGIGVVGVGVGCPDIVGGEGGMQVIDMVDSECVCAWEHRLGCGAGSAQISDRGLVVGVRGGVWGSGC